MLADSVDAVVIELLLAERVGTQAYLQNRDARRIELHHRRGLDSRRQRRADAVGRRHDLRDGEVEIDVRLEKNLLHREPGQGLSLDVLDAVDVRTDRILAVSGDALVHLRRAKTGIAPDHRHDRNIDFRKDVRGHFPGCDDAQKQDKRRDHIECVRKSQSETNNAHG